MMIEQFILGLARNFQSKTIFLILQFTVHFTVSRKKMVKTSFYISAILVAWSVFEPPFLNKSI